MAVYIRIYVETVCQELVKNITLNVAIPMLDDRV